MPPSWIPNALMTLLQLSQLGKNWDSYGGHPVRPEALGRAVQLLAAVSDPYWPVPEPAAIGSAGDGSVGFTWIEPDIEFDLAPLDELRVFASGCVGPDDDAFAADTLAELCKLLAEVFDV